MRIRTMITAVGVAVAAVLATVAASSTATAAPATAAASTSTLRGVTAVTTAPGLAKTLLRAGILPLPTPGTSFRLGTSAGGLAVTYGFPIVGGNPDLTGPSGNILHNGGINFVSVRGRLEIGKFDIALADGKIFARQVNFAKGRIPVLDLDLSALKVTTSHGATVLSGVKLFLDPVAAEAINSTFRLALPTDGSLLFGTATITLRT